MSLPHAAFVPLVATVYPRPIVEDLLEWSDTKPALRGADDGIVARYCRTKRITPLAMNPCICDHDVEVISVGKRYPRPGPQRQAIRLIY